MKKIIAIIAQIFLIGIFLANAESITIGNSLGSPYFGIEFYMRDYRATNGGTKIIVTYDGDWPEEMRGAFEYAVKMYEEVLPPMLPLYITAKLESLRSSSKQISKVNYETYSFNGMWDDMYACPSSMIKNVIFEEYHNNHITQFYDEIEDASFFETPDIEITYNKDFIDYLSFSLDGDYKAHKYDFITIALRDIALGLGFGTRFMADTETQKLLSIPGKLTPFETVVMNALDARGDLKKAYTNATKGKLPIDIGVPNSYMYAPYTWQDGVSLHYFSSYEGNMLSNLLTPEIGQGYVFRNLSGIPWPLLFQTAFSCYPNIPTGNLVGGISVCGTSRDLLPYKGNVTLTLGSERSNEISEEDNEIELLKEQQGVSITNTASNSVMNYLHKFNTLGTYHEYLFCPLYSLSVLMKDGTWDEIYGKAEDGVPIAINIESLKLNYPEDKYARGVTGGLKYRLTKCEPVSQQLHQTDKCYYVSKYFTRDFTPQKAKIKYLPQSSRSVFSLAEDNSDDYYVDVKVGLSDIEGADRIVVEQLDEGEMLPFTYEVGDFRKGYFIANLDRELTTTLTVISYNEYGFRRSNTITIPPIGYPVGKISFKKMGNEILIEGIPTRMIETGNVNFSIQEVMSGSIVKDNQVFDGEKISVSDIPSGIYVINVIKGNTKLGQFRFGK